MAAEALAWLTGPGIYHGRLSLSSQESGDGIIESAQLLPYPVSSLDSTEDASYDDRRQERQTERPVGMALTEFHFILIYVDKVRVIRVLDDEIVFEEALDLVRLLSF
jgi:hypothetical protein